MRALRSVFHAVHLYLEHSNEQILDHADLWHFMDSADTHEYQKKLARSAEFTVRDEPDV